MIGSPSFEFRVFESFKQAGSWLAERILIVCPSNLSFQWQRELKEKFDVAQQGLAVEASDAEAKLSYAPTSQ